MTSGAVITGLGVALPDKTLTNADLEARMDTSDQWIIERTGIRERRVGGITSNLSAEASRQAMEAAGVGPADIDLLVLSTTTPDQMVPATASAVQDMLGLRCGAFDVNAACSGFVYGLVTAHAFARMGKKRMLVIGCDTLSRITDYDDRGTAILFADGAGAAVVEAVDGPGELLGWDLDSDGSARSILYADIGDVIRMEGREVFRRAVRVMVDSAQRSLEMAGLTPADVSMCVPHQANVRIIESANQRLGIPMEKTSVVLHRTGNTSSGSIPLALEDAVRTGRVHRGDIVLLVGFGAGMTSASAVLRWGGE
jgi:3-oxoacyl-[acyl-carrier-protein] synthase-3